MSRWSEKTALLNLNAMALFAEDVRTGNATEEMWDRLREEDRYHYRVRAARDLDEAARHYAVGCGDREPIRD